MAGEIDARTAPDLRAQLHHVIDAHPGEVVTVDLSGLEFMDSTGLGVLIGAQKRARQQAGDIALLAVPPPIVRLLHMTGLDKVFDVTEPG